MFAVPGWNLSAPLKTDSDAAANSKKRKRQGKKGGGGDKDGDGKDEGKGQGPNVTSENVADMWAEVVEGTSKSKDKEGAERKMRSQKHEYKAAQKLEMQAKQKMEKEEREREGGGKPPKSKKLRREEDGKGSKKEVKEEEGDASKGHDASKQETAAKGKKQKKKDTKQQPNTTTPTTAAAAAPSPLPHANTAKLTPLQAKMREKLASARFRHLNQTLYTTPSAHSLALIEDDPQIFNEYHAGFRQQVAVWPENPVDTFVQLVQRRGALRGDARKKAAAANNEDQDDAADAPAKALKPLPRDFRTHVCTIADLGCGDATLSSSLQPSLRKLKLAIHSFDLAAPSPLITKADISALPLRDGAVDVAIFCLALMGTNWPDFVDEAYRVLRWKGELWVAEIKSRFGRVAAAGSKDAKQHKVVDHSVGRRQKSAAAKHNKANRDAADAAAADDEALAVEIDGAVPARANETDVSAFVAALRARGFVLDAESPAPVDLRNKMFVRMQFVKAAAPTKGKNVRSAREAVGGGKAGGRAKKFVEEEGEEEIDEAALLKPCVYKLR